MKITKISFKTLSFVALLCFLTPSLAQEQVGLRERANQLYKAYKYASASKIYLKLSSKKKPNLQDMERLADCYFKMNNYEDAEKWYAYIAVFPGSKPENLINYGESLKAIGNYDKAKQVLKDYVAKTGNFKDVANAIAGCDSALVWIAKPTAHVIKNEAAVNTKNAEFSVFTLGNDVYYAAERENHSNVETYGWTGNSFLKLYTAKRNADHSLSTPKLMQNVINEEIYHVGPAASNKTGDVLYITRTYPGNQGAISKEKGRKYQINKLELFIQKKINGIWQKAEPFPYNNVKQYSVGHASLSTDEKKIYFISDMPGGKGGTDIWFCELQSDGQWSTPVNAGNIINTAGEEMFPSIAADGTLFYSTDGLPGMGGLDIFSSKGELANWSQPVNLGYPINSAGDDFAFTITDSYTSGYLSSNRKGGEGNDDIYSFNIDLAKIIPPVIDKPDTMVRPISEKALFEKGKALAIRNIHYDFDKANIRPDAALILDELVRTMNKYPSLKVELGSHTDSRGMEIYNLDLSQRRAQSAVNYLVKSGVARDRMVAKGYGETRLLIGCSNKMRCTAAEHQVNRRTEFIVLEY